MVGDLQFFHLSPQGGTVNPQFFRGFFDFSAVFPEGFEDQFLFKFSHGIASSFLAFEVRFPSQVCGETFGTDVAGFAQNKGVLNDILEFTNISRVVVIQQDFQGWVSEPGNASALDLVKPFQKVVNEEGDVLRSLSQGRDIDGDHIEPIVEVFPKFARPDT